MTVFTAYGPSLPGGFVYDDHHFVENNHAIRGLDQTFRFFYDPSTLSDADGLNTNAYRPLAVLSYALNYALTGLNPAGFRTVNLLLHCANVLLVFYLGRLLGLAGAYAALMGAFFALFPANVEAVAWISSRSTVLSTVFILCALVCFIKRVDQDNPGYWPPAALCTIAALFTREVAVVIPLLALAYLAAYRRPVKKHLGAIGLYLALPVLLFTLLRTVLLDRLGQAPQPDLPLPAFLALPPLLFAKYLDIMLYPFSMLITYSDIIHLRLEAFWFYFPFALAVFLLYAGLTAWLRARGGAAASLGLLWLCIAFLPVLNMIPLLFYMAERLIYLPLAGFALTVAAAARYINERYRCRTLLWTGCGALLVIFTLNIRARLPVWSSDIALWQYDAVKNPWNFLTRLRLAEALRASDNYAGAALTLNQAMNLATTPLQRSVAYNEIGTIHAMNGDLKKAEIFFKTALTLNPSSYLTLYNLGKVCMLRRDLTAAGKYLAGSLALNAKFTPASKLAAELKLLPRPGAAPRKLKKTL